MVYRFFLLIIACAWLAGMFGRSFLRCKLGLEKRLSLPQNQRLSQRELRRFEHYFYGTTYLAAFMCCLRGKPRTRQEARIFLKLAALASIFDDLVDTLPKTENGHSWRENPETFGIKADPRGLARGLLTDIYGEIPAGDLPGFQTAVQRVFEAELRLQPEVSLAEISAKKGGNSVLLFRRALAHPFAPKEEDAMFAFGALIQLADDIFDLWHDRQTGHKTVATVFAERGDCTGLAAFFEQQLHTTQTALRNTTYPPGRVEATLAVLHFLASLTRVCLRHYQMTEKYCGGLLPLHDRTRIVVDMEKWTNRWRAAGQLLRFVR